MTLLRMYPRFFWAALAVLVVGVFATLATLSLPSTTSPPRETAVSVGSGAVLVLDTVASVDAVPRASSVFTAGAQQEGPSAFLVGFGAVDLVARNMTAGHLQLVLVLVSLAGVLHVVAIRLARVNALKLVSIASGSTSGRKTKWDPRRASAGMKPWFVAGL